MKGMKYRLFRLLLTSCVLSFAGNAYSQDWISLGSNNKDEAVTTKILEDNTSVYKVKYSINGLYDKIITNEKGLFHFISLGNDNNLSVIGAPSLPRVNRFIAIPEGADISVSVAEEKWTEIEIGQVYPSQRPTLENEKASEFIFDENAYREMFVPQQIQIEKGIEWRGINCANISICPFRYNPVDGRLFVMREFVLQIGFVHDILSMRRKKVYENADPFHMFDNHIFSVSDNIAGNICGIANKSFNYPKGDLLIIVGENMKSIVDSQKMQEYRLWKAFRGINTRIDSTTVIGSGEDNIKSYISQQYNDGVRYVLFVGDVNKITPMYFVSQDDSREIHSDYWFGCLGGDNDIIADVAIGRFSTNIISDFSNMVDKTIKYEKCYHPLNKALLVAYFYYGETGFMECCESIRTTAYLEPMLFSHTYGDSATNNDVIQQINTMANIINYRGHGGVDVWGQEDSWEIIRWNRFLEEFHKSQINNMSDETCSVFFSIACNNGSIQAGYFQPNENEQDSVCMLEAFTRAPNGASAFLGASTDTYPTVNNSFNMGLFHKLLNDSVYRIGDLINSAHARCISQFGGNDIRANENPFCYILGGDPTLEIWTREPQTINNVNFDIVGDSVYISYGLISNDSSFCSIVRAEDGVNISNVKNVGCSFRFPKPDYNFYAVINSHNYYPYIIYCDFETLELTNTVIENEEHYYGSPFDIIDSNINGESESAGVIVQNGGKLVIHKGSDGVIIYDGFECKQGTSFEIK